MTLRDRAALVRPAVFGAFDGVVTVLGVVFTLSSRPHELVLSGVGLATAGAVSMGGGEYLSDSEHGPAASVAIGLTTAAGTLLPVVPYALLPGRPAGVVSAALCAAVAAVIVRLKATEPGAPSVQRLTLRTFGLLIAAAGFTWLCSMATGAVG